MGGYYLSESFGRVVRVVQGAICIFENIIVIYDMIETYSICFI